MDPAERSEGDGLEATMRAARPRGPGERSLEQRLAIASIVAAASPGPERPQLGRLEVQSRLGGGGMGVVYRAYDPNLRRLVAVKLLRGWTEHVERVHIADEARALAKLSHPNVVTVYDIVEDEQGLYFTMEYVAGATLRRWLDTHPEADWREVFGWFIQAGQGLVAAHEAGIVHRDFKPENVLVGQDGRVRVADFGLALEPDDDDEANVGGTLYYLAPEIQQGAPATPSSDQFSFCKALHDAVAEKEPPSLTLAAIERGMSTNPDSRHDSLSELLRMLEGALEAGSAHRPRALLLERLERLWLRGVLEGSLGEGSAIELGLIACPDLVNPPWEPWGAMTGPRSRASSRELSHILNESNGSLLVVGPPGCGKTTILLLLARDLWRTASVNPEAPAPVVLSLSTYQPETRDGHSMSEHFGNWVVDELVTKYGLPRPAVKRWFAESGIVLLLDGLDETDSSQRARVVETLNRFREDHPLNMVVTSRDHEYDALEERLTFGGAVTLQPIDDRGIVRLLEERRATHLKEQLDRDGELRELLRNPLLLTLYAGDGDEDVGDKPGWTRAYERYVRRCFSESSEEERTRLTKQLSWLARAMEKNNTSDLWLERLSFSWLETRWERWLGYLSGVVVVFLFGVGMNSSQTPITNAPLVAGLTFGFGVSVSSFAYTRGRIEPVMRLQWSLRRALRLFPITVLCASVISLAEALRINFTSNMVAGAILGTVLAIAFALEPGPKPIQLRANAGIRVSLANALKVSFGFGAPVALVYGLILQPHLLNPLAVVKNEYDGNAPLIVALTVGLFTFTALFLIYGGFTFLMHAVLRLWMVWRTPMPVNMEGMLDRAVELGLMRRVGGGYVFLHRTLLGYFAGSGNERARTD